MNGLEFVDYDELLGSNYYAVQHLLINGPLSPKTIECYKNIIFSPNAIRQIYFIGECDIDTVELIKSLLSISEYIDDETVEKYILVNFSEEELSKLLNGTYENPSTWQIIYYNNDKNYRLIDIPRYRSLRGFIQKLYDPSLSPAEQILKIYDEVKMLEFDESLTGDQVYNIMNDKRADDYGFNFFFCYILNKLGYNAAIGTKEEDGKRTYTTLVDVQDPEYKIDGIYMFDPSMDSLPKEKYEINDVRRMNYNFFMTPISLIERNTFGERFSGALAYLGIEDLNFSVEKKDTCRDNGVLRETEQLETTFGLSYDKLHERLWNTKEVPVEMIVLMCEKLYTEPHSEILRDNYIIRKEELFGKDVNEELDGYLKEAM